MRHVTKTPLRKNDRRPAWHSFPFAGISASSTAMWLSLPPLDPQHQHLEESNPRWKWQDVQGPDRPIPLPFLSSFYVGMFDLGPQ